MKSAVSKITAASQRVLTYQILNEEIDFTFEVWAYAQMPCQLAESAYHAFLARQDTSEKRQSLAGCIIRHMTNHGLPFSEQP